MGNICCPSTSPCPSREETGVLLNHNSKTTGPTAVESDFQSSPEADEKIRKLPDEVSWQIPQVEDPKPNNTQENGHLQKENIQKTAPSPKKEVDLKQNPATKAQDETIKDEPATEPLISTLNSPQKDHAAADWEVFVAEIVKPIEETSAPVQHETPAPVQYETPVQHESPAPVQHKVPESVFEAVTTEKPSDTTADVKEHIAPHTTQKNKREGGCDSEVHVVTAAAEPSGEMLQCKKVCLVSNIGCHVTSTAAASQDISTVSPNRAVNKTSGSPLVCCEVSPEDIKSHALSEPCSGPEPTGLDHSAVVQNYANSVREPLATPPLESSDSSSATRHEKPDIKFTTVDLKELASSENEVQDTVKTPGLEVQNRVCDPKEVDDEKQEEEKKKNAPTETVDDAEIQEEGEVPVAQKEVATDESLTDSEEDLYRGADELPASRIKTGPAHVSSPQVEDRCSLATAVDILSYSEREWKGNTAKSALIRKGYKVMSQTFGSLRRVRGDNYCALRATLFQVLCHATQVPAWLQQEDITLLPEELEAQEGLVSQWLFPGECRQGNRITDATQQLKGYMELLQKKWRAVADCSGAVERLQLCERLFQGGEEELGLLEALKLLMLGRAVELHGHMHGGVEVPLFSWLLFARDSSDCPRSFLSNHLSHMGLSAGLEQLCVPACR
ncbi:uncharacterized protein LOC117507489 isoform X2 [Thalassophryne amazonica]|uniref:uncharacterized protein LOC117507489 isoform X2 n=1 Tax=Thalassophryne amazonica TaxID=390379 RepID=UPI001471D403|nr:uncharacterized protein LOC117507489 isoform X2 [Thalassophryne amazonica]